MKNLRKSVKGTPTCVYFLRGYCAKASKCTFRHEKPEPEKKKPITKVVELMTASISHRGPDDRGFFHNENISFGHNMFALHSVHM